MTPTTVPAKPSALTPLLRPLYAFLAEKYAGGILLMAAAIAAMIWANSPWAHSYYTFWHTDLTLALGRFSGTMSLHHLVNDGLMAVFFLLVGLEIKRELLVGELASFRSAALPVAGAIGGVAVP